MCSAGGYLQMVAVRKNLDLVWVWFYKDVAPTALANMKKPLEKFGKFFVQNLRDKMLDDLEMLLRGGSKAPKIQELQNKISNFNEAQKGIVREMAEEIITSGMHDLLFAIQEEADANGAIKVLVDGQEVAKLSDGMHGEIFGDDGWIVRYSKYPSAVEIERSKWAKQRIKELFGEK